MADTKSITSLIDESSLQLTHLLDTLPDALLFLDTNGTILYANAAAATSIGMTQRELRGNTLWRCAPKLVNTAFYQAVVKATRTREPLQMAYRSPGTNIWLHVRILPSGESIAVYFSEETEPLQFQHAFSRHELVYQSLLESFSDGVVITTPDGLVLDINQQPLTDKQVQRQEVVGKLFPDLPEWSYDPAVQQRLRAAIEQASRGETARFEARLRLRPDKYLDALMVITPHRDATQQIDYLICVGQDITARKRVEEELRLLIDAIPHFVWVMRPDGSGESGNQRWTDYTAMTNEQTQGKGWLQTVHPDDYQRAEAARRRACATGEPFESEFRLREGKTGSYRWFLARGVPARDETGQVVKWFGTCTDIDEQKRIEEALRLSQKHIRTLIDSNIIGIVVSEVEGDALIEANETFLRMTGYTREDMQSGELSQIKIIPPEMLSFMQRATQELIEHGQHLPFEAELVCKDGSRLAVVMGGVFFQNQAISFVLDNSAHKELEQRKDDFISMASHELRNPLTALKLQTSLLHRQLAKQDLLESVPALSAMETQINAIARLVEELLDVSKIQAGRLEYARALVDLDALLWETADTMQQTHPCHRILVHGATQARLMGDRDRLGQVFTNLLSNAIKYSPDAQIVEMNLSATPEEAIVQVRDYGLGIPREQRDKIFERFYRAADPRQRAIPGLGMGLYIVAQTIKHHGGTITVDSEIGKGSTFCIALPLRTNHII